MRIIDFDNSMPFGAVATGKASTAYCPPEHCEKVIVAGTGLSSGSIKAHFDSNPAQDMWALGALLYLLCTGVSLFFCDMEDNVADADDLLALSVGDDKFRDRKLLKITDKLARNLVSLMLTKNVEKRIDAVHVL